MNALDASSASCVPESQDSKPTHDEHGVDLTLIHELLQLEPIERLRLNDRAVNAVLELRRAFDARQ